ncbi:MAG: hypothetical protein WBM13_06805 [Bacteroidia bacterium]
MLNEIINKYEQFSDALISEISYKSTGNKKNLDVVIKCMNSLKDFEFETIKLTFIDLISVRFIEREKMSSVLINSALLKKTNNIIMFDFFPTTYDNNLVENLNSDFIIKCKEVYYDVLEK